MTSYCLEASGFASSPGRRGRLICDECGCHPRRPAIGLCLTVLCARCAPRHGMCPGEHGEVHSYEEWKQRALRAQYPEAHICAVARRYEHVVEEIEHDGLEWIVFTDRGVVGFDMLDDAVEAFSTWEGADA